jgi:hypothetical protein
MKGTFALALMATAATSMKLTAWNQKIFNDNLLDNKLSINWNANSEWYWGIRSPIQWAKFENYHEAISWSEEAYTKFTFGT